MRAHVAMDDAERMALFVGRLVRAVEPAGDLHRDRHGVLERNPPALPQHADGLREGCTMHPLHDEVVAAALLTKLLDADDVRVVDTRREDGLVDEHAGEALLGREVIVNHLDGDGPREPGMADAAREVEHAHRSRAEAREDAVATERASRLERVHAPSVAWRGQTVTWSLRARRRTSRRP